MDRPRLIKGLRITVSAVCLVVWVLLVASWLRSYYVGDVLYVQTSSTTALAIHSLKGRLIGMALPVSEMPGKGGLWLGYFAVSSRVYFPSATVLPFWFPSLIAVILSASPWIRWKFSLRTLLLATTLIAVVLGLVVWSMS